MSTTEIVASVCFVLALGSLFAGLATHAPVFAFVAGGALLIMYVIMFCTI